jgi:hypothetical protein
VKEEMEKIFLNIQAAKDTSVVLKMHVLEFQKSPDT